MICTRCQVDKPRAAFGTAKNRRCRDCRAAIERERRLLTGDQIRARDRARYAANPGVFAARARETRIRNAAAIAAQKQTAHMRAQTGATTDDHVAYARALLADPCAYCGAPATELDHIEPTSTGGARDVDNLTAACRSCNPAKGAKPLLLFLAHRNGCYEFRRDLAPPE